MVVVFSLYCCLLLGTKIELLHLRRTEQCRDGEQIEELKPIDKNLQYDFNFQQTIHIDEVIVKPVRDCKHILVSISFFVSCSCKTIDKF